MSVLSAQTIRRYCVQRTPPLISPFVGEKIIKNGKSYGLSACTYDCRIAMQLILEHGEAALANTIESFSFPNNICGSVLDKSSYARLFVSAFNTHLDPGWSGNLTLEIVNHGNKIVILEGSPICQIKFEFLDEATESPYEGKYQNQAFGPQPVLFDKDSFHYE